MKQNGEIYECYSRKVFGLLTMKGIDYKSTFIHKDSGKKAWVYIMTDEISQALIEWKNSNPNQKF